MTFKHIKIFDTIFDSNLLTNIQVKFYGTIPLYRYFLYYKYNYRNISITYFLSCGLCLLAAIRNNFSDSVAPIALTISLNTPSDF